MRTVTKAEAERDFAAVLNAAANEPVCIRQAGQDAIVVSAVEFDEAQRLLHAKRMRALRRARLRVSVEAEAIGFSQDMLAHLFLGGEGLTPC